MMYKTDSYTTFLIIASTSNEGIRSYCMRCERLVTDGCSCAQCEDCKMFYANIVAHKCNKSPSWCINCGLDITSPTNMCYRCDFDEIMDICEILGDMYKYN